MIWVMSERIPNKSNEKVIRERGIDPVDYDFQEPTPDVKLAIREALKGVIKRNPDTTVVLKKKDLTVPVDLSRRSFLIKGALGVAGITVGGTLINEGLKNILLDYGLEDDDFKESENEKVESIPGSSERFEAEMLGYKALMNLRKDEVLFVDENNIPVGEPVRFEDFVVDRSLVRRDGAGDYLLTPGRMNLVGIPEGGIAGEWLDYVREKVQEKYPNQKITSTLHNVTDFEAALKEEDEPELVEDIKSGKIVTRADIVAHFAKKKVIGAEQYNRAQYVKELVKFRDDVPDCVQNEFKRLLPGLCAQESKFNAGVKSEAVAIGVMQIIPGTWNKYGGDGEGSMSLSKQLEVAGNLMSGMYTKVQDLIGEDTLNIFREKFNTEEDFQKDFLCPVTINSYNAGEARVADAVNHFAKNFSREQIPSGKDLYLAVADHASKSNESDLLRGYKRHSREYVTKVYANADVLEEMGLLNEEEKEIV